MGSIISNYYKERRIIFSHFIFAAVLQWQFFKLQISEIVGLFKCFWNYLDQNFCLLFTSCVSFSLLIIFVLFFFVLIIFIYPLITSCLLPQWNIGALGSPPMKYKMERFLLFFLLWNKTRTCLLHFLACKVWEGCLNKKYCWLKKRRKKQTVGWKKKKEKQTVEWKRKKKQQQTVKWKTMMNLPGHRGQISRACLLSLWK